MVVMMMMMMRMMMMILRISIAIVVVIVAVCTCFYCDAILLATVMLGSLALDRNVCSAHTV